MNQADVLSLLQRHGALRRGHFVGTSGRHLDTYVNKDAVYPHPWDLDLLVSHLAVRVAMLGGGAPVPIEAVVGPETGGIVLANRLAALIGNWVLAAWAGRNADGSFTLRRGYDRLVAGRNVVVVDDVVTTGGSVRAVVEAVRAAEGNVVGVAALVNRGGVTAGLLGVPRLVTLADLDLASWDEAECPLCRDGVPVDTEVGKSREFLEQKGSR